MPQSLPLPLGARVNDCTSSTASRTISGRASTDKVPLDKLANGSNSGHPTVSSVSTVAVSRGLRKIGALDAFSYAFGALKREKIIEICVLILTPAALEIRHGKLRADGLGSLASFDQADILKLACLVDAFPIVIGGNDELDTRKNELESFCGGRQVPGIKGDHACNPGRLVNRRSRGEAFSDANPIGMLDFADDVICALFRCAL